MPQNTKKLPKPYTTSKTITRSLTKNEIILSQEKTLSRYKTVIVLSMAGFFISLFGILAIAVCYSVLLVKYEQTSFRHEALNGMVASMFKDTMVWQMDKSCATQFASSTKLHLLIERLGDVEPKK